MPPNGTRQSLADCLPADARALWVEYLDLHDQGRRNEALDRLDAFTERVSAADAAAQRSFVEAVAREWLDGTVAVHRGGPAELRYPLIAHLVLPHLRKGRDDGQPNYSRWLAFALLGHAAGPPTLRENLPSPRALLEEALRVDPNDDIAHRALLGLIVAGLEYDFHELPAGLLSPAEEILGDLTEIERLADKLGVREGLEQRLKFWRGHANGYREYLAARPRWNTYAAYMDEHGLALDADASTDER